MGEPCVGVPFQPPHTRPQSSGCSGHCCCLKGPEPNTEQGFSSGVSAVGPPVRHGSLNEPAALLGWGWGAGPPRASAPAQACSLVTGCWDHLGPLPQRDLSAEQGTEARSLLEPTSQRKKQTSRARSAKLEASQLFKSSDASW